MINSLIFAQFVAEAFINSLISSITYAIEWANTVGIAIVAFMLAISIAKFFFDNFR